MTSYSVALAFAADQMKQGILSLDEANVEIVRMMGVRIVKGSLPSAVRKALNSAVKSGYLGRFPKNGLMPEAYFHPNSRANAIDERNRIARSAIESIKSVCV